MAEKNAVPKRVLVFVSTMGAGGAERAAVRLSGWLVEAGHEVTLLTTSSQESDFYSSPSGVVRIGLDLQRPSPNAFAAMWANLRRLWEVRRAVRKQGSQVVISLGDRNNILLLLATIGLGCRKIISDRTDPMREPLSRVWSLWRRWSYPMADMHVAQSQYAVGWIKTHFPGLPSTVIGNATASRSDIGNRKRDDEIGPLCLVAVGRLTEAKGIDLLLAAFVQASARTSRPLHLTLVGDGEDRAVLEDQVMALNLQDAVRFVGRVSDVGAWLCKADVYVLASRWEGFPNALVEAMGIGLPVIAAYCRGGVEDVLGGDGGTAAVVFEPGDIHGLADAIVRVAEDPALRDRLAVSALRRADDYSPERIAGAWRDVVEQP